MTTDMEGASPLALACRGMGTDIELRLWPAPGRATAARRALHRAAAFLQTAEQRLSRFRPDSELSRINRGCPGPVSRLTVQVVQAALEAARATGGLFDPTLERALVAAGYDRTFEEIGGGRPAAVQHAAAPGRYAAVVVDVRRRTVTPPPDAGLDLGGIAKGWLADAVVRRLARYGAALAGLGGDIAVAGVPPDSNAWEIEVEDPGGGPPLAVLRLREGGVATSGVLRRRWQTAAGPQHHLMDPRTGRPAQSDLVAVTVVAPTATAAEAAAKAALLLGAASGQAALDASPGLAGLLVTAAGEIVHTNGMHGFLVA